MGNIDVREMDDSDWEQVAFIYKQGIDSNDATFVRELPSYVLWDRNHLKECRFVAEIEGKITGFIALGPTSIRESFKGVVEVSVYIDRNFQKSGVGSALMETLIEASEKYGYWCLYSSIFVENQGSRKLHEKYGFRLIGTREKIAKDRLGNWRDTAIYERRSKNIV